MATENSHAHLKNMVHLGFANEKVPLGSHICLFYRTKSERDNLVIPFIKQGLEDNAGCQYIVDEQAASRLYTLLSREGLNVSGLQASGQLKILSSEDTYLANSPFDSHAMIIFLEKITQGFLQEGYPYLRGTSDVTFLKKDAPAFKDFMFYESSLNSYIRDLPVVVLCQYNITKFSGDIIIGALQTHPYSIMGGVLIKNPFYIPPERFLSSN